MLVNFEREDGVEILVNVDALRRIQPAEDPEYTIFVFSSSATESDRLLVRGSMRFVMERLKSAKAAKVL